MSTKKYFSHNSAIIDEGATIGKDTKIWHFSHVSSKAVIGEKCSLGQNVYIANKVRLGRNVKIQNNVSVYDNVFIEDDVFCGPSMVFTNVTNPRSFIIRKDEYKNTYVKQGASIGANATILCGIKIGEYAFVAAGATVTKNVKPFSLVAGIPAKQIGWISKFGERMDLPLSGNGEWTCPNLNETYILEDSSISIKNKT